MGYTYRTESPGGFPYETDFWLFARLAHTARREFTRDLRLTLVWHDDPQFRPEVWSRPFQIMTFRPAHPIRDMAASVSGIFEGPGRYEFRLLVKRRKLNWRGEWRWVASHYIAVE